MKIMVLGGAGDMGSRAAEDLAGSPGVALVTIADRNLSAGEELAARLSGQGAEVNAVRVDANDHPGLVEAMRGYDVCASTLGPFHLFEKKLVRAAIEAGVDYASICDEWQPAKEVLDEFSDEAGKKEVTVITGLGASPGISNLGVRYLASRLDRTRKAEVYVYLPLDAGGGPAVISHTLFIMSREMPVWRGGKREMTPALRESRVVEFPRFGRRKLWNMGHSEPETIPRLLPEIEEVNFFMGFGRGSSLLLLPAKMGLFSGPRGFKFSQRALEGLEKVIVGSEPGWGAIRIDVWGELKGKEEHLMACGVAQMREATGLSLSVGAMMLGKKEILTEEGGVYAPEACLEPVKFLSYMKERGIIAYQDLAMAKEVI